MKVSKKNFQRGGYYENRTDFVLAPQDYAALGSAYDDKTRAYLNSQAKAKLDSDKKAKEGIRAFENRTKVMNRLNGQVQGAYDIWFEDRQAAIANPTAEAKMLADESYSQYTTLKNAAVAITTDYQNEVNSINKGELDASLLGNRAEALLSAKEFNQEIPFTIENVGGRRRIVVPGADGQPVDWTQSTFFDESVFGLNGRNFIASRKAPGTDFMFAPLSDKYATEMQGNENLMFMEGDRKKGLNPAAVGGIIEQRFRNDMNANAPAVIDAVSQQYGAFATNQENLTVEGMLQAEKNYGDSNNTVYSNKFLTDWNLVFDENQGEIGEYKVVFKNPAKAIQDADMSPQTAAAVKNRQDALGYQIENLANQTYFKLRGQTQVTPQGGGIGFGFKKGDRLPEFRDVALYSTPGGAVQGKSLDLAVNPVPIRFLGKSAKITNIQYDPSAANSKNPRNVVYGFTVEAGPLKDAALGNINQSLTDIKDEISEFQRDIDSPLGLTVEKREQIQSQIGALRDTRNQLKKDRATIKNASEEISITRRALAEGPNDPAISIFRNLGQAGEFLEAEGLSTGDVPAFDEILTSLYGQERQLMEAAQQQFAPASGSNNVSSQEDPLGLGI